MPWTTGTIGSEPQRNTPGIIARGVTEGEEDIQACMDEFRRLVLPGHYHLKGSTADKGMSTPGQQRALIRQVMTTIWIEKGAVTAIRPAQNYTLLVETMAGR